LQHPESQHVAAIAGMADAITTLIGDTSQARHPRTSLLIPTRSPPTSAAPSAGDDAQAGVKARWCARDILDRLVTQAGEVSISRSRLENEVDTLRNSLATSPTTWPACAATCAKSRCRPNRRSPRAWPSPASANSTRWNSTASRACRNSPA
jgi:hypothetical protein